MFWLSFLAILGLRVEGIAGAPAPQPAVDKAFETRQIKAFAPRSELKVADTILPLKRTSKKSPSSSALLSVAAKSGTTPLEPVEEGGGFAIDVSLGGSSYEVIFDTGSSDLWVIESDYKCLGPKGHRKPDSFCDFGPGFSGTFDDGSISNENFNITYGDGTFAVGTLGYEDVTVAGITVDKQEMALIDEAFFLADGTISGLMGFAYPSLTSTYKGTNPAVDSNANQVHYPNWITNAINQKKIAPLFSCAIERGKGDGQLAIGGLPSISFDHTFTSTPIEIKKLTPHPIERTQYSYYTIQPDGVVVDGTSKTINFPMIVDSGTTLLYVPPKLAKEINAAYDPPSQYIEKEGVFENYCNAKPPTVAITIGGTHFTISSHELLLQGKLGKDPSTGGCVTGIQPGPSKNWGILGDVFLKNVVAVFDIGASEMKFAPHVNY